VELPPNPFSGVQFEPRQSLKYSSQFEVEKLAAQAEDELALTDPEVFKAFLLALMCGLRRNEIDLLEWSSFQWNQNVILILPTKFFVRKARTATAR